MNPIGGKAAIQPTTVFNHVITSLIFGIKVDLQRLAQQCATIEGCSLPTVGQWREMEEAAVSVNMSSNNPLFMEFESQKVLLTEILGTDLMGKESGMRTLSEKALLNEWYGKMRWWKHLKVAGWDPLNGVQGSELPASKRTRL